MYAETGNAPAAGRQQSIVEALRRIIRAVELHSRKLEDEHGLTGPQLAALQAIASGSSSPSEVAQAIHLSAGTVSGILARLERRGLVERGPSARDRRRVELRLSELGTRVLERAPSLLQDRFRDELARLEEWEQHLLLASLQRIASMMDAGGLDAAPHLSTLSDLSAAGDPSVNA